MSTFSVRSDSSNVHIFTSIIEMSSDLPRDTKLTMFHEGIVEERKAENWKSA